MKPLYIILKKGKTPAFPSRVCLIHDNQKHDKLLFDATNVKSIHDIRQDLNKFKAVIEKAIIKKIPIITNDRRSFQNTFEPPPFEDNNLYDYNLIINDDEHYNNEINTEKSYETSAF